MATHASGGDQLRGALGASERDEERLDARRAARDLRPAIAIGNQTGFSAPTPTFPFEYALQAGFDAFEFFPDLREDTGQGFREADLDAATRADLRNLAVGRGMRLSVHAPWWIDPLTPGALDELAETQRFALDLGARVVVVHLYLQQGVETYVEAVSPLIELLAAEGQQLALENTVETGPEQVNAVFAELSRRQPELHQSYGLCLDIGHANLCAATRNDYLAFIDRLEPTVPVIHAHLHENWGDADTHLPLFCGPAGEDPAGVEGLCDRLLARGFGGALILEQWPDPPQLLDQAHRRLRELLLARGALAPAGDGDIR
jgi:sugar phosphate isomerase/epimerase